MIQRQKKHIKPVFHHIPNWLQAYRGGSKLTPNAPQFHFYSSRDNLSQPVTLYVSAPENSQSAPQPVTMYYNVEPDFNDSIQTNKDQSTLKDFSYLNIAEGQQHEIIPVSRDQAVKESSWVKKYEPKRFIQLLSDDLINRNVLTWLKSWDQIVFKKKPAKSVIQPSSALFRRGNNAYNQKSNFVVQQFNYKKLILLAGPPGCGKTTLARVVARHCGYHWQQINASDDRSAKALITKIDNLATNKTVGREQKPVCIIIDEVDGALDSDANGIKDVLQYIETGVVPGQPKKNTKTNKKGGKAETKEKEPTHKAEPTEPSQARKTKIDRPIIFICNDPFVRGLRQLRSHALVVYFNQLQSDRVVKRLKQITDHEDIRIEGEVLTKICSMCSNDVRSSVGILQLLAKFKTQLNRNPKDILSKMRLAFAKDTVTSTNQFLQKLSSVPAKSSASDESNNQLFSSFQSFLWQHPNPSLLFQTFAHNLPNHKHIFFRMELATRLYRELVNYDVRVNQHHGQIDQFAPLPYLLFKIEVKPDQQKKIEFPNIFFEKLSKMRNNKALIQKILKGIPSHLRVFNSSEHLSKEMLYLFWLTMQTGSPREQEVLRCVYKMLTYGIKLAPRGAPHIFTPQFEHLLTFGQNKPQVSLSSTTRNLMEENYEFLKLKNQLIAEASVDGNGKQNYQTVINQLKRNRRRNRQLTGGIVKYKYLEGTGTQIKYDLKIGNFFEEKKLL